MNARQPPFEKGPAARLFALLIEALHEESDALIANDGTRIAAAAGRKQALLDALAPQTRALRAELANGSQDIERLAREAAQLNALNAEILGARATVARGRAEVLRQAAEAVPLYRADGTAAASAPSPHPASRA
jgi:flagellar biosynthesis/type III secretory pathway chaperone